jgi:hypothetical protein
MDKKKDPRGRKRVEDPKVGIRIYTYQSEVDQLGGIPAVQIIMTEAVKKKLKSKIK